MKYTKEQLQALSDKINRWNPTYEEEDSDFISESSCNRFGHLLAPHHKALRAVLDAAISKMETTTEQSSEVDDNGMPHEIFANAFGDWMHHPKKDSDPIGFRTTRYTRAEPQGVEPIEGLDEAINLENECLYVTPVEAKAHGIVLEAARAYLTLTKRGV